MEKSLRTWYTVSDVPRLEKDEKRKYQGNSMWQKISRIILIAICLTGIVGLLYLDNREEVNSDEMELSFYLEDEVIRAWKGEDAYYLFLPSYADVSDLRMTPYASGFEIIPTGESVKKGDSLYDFSYNEKYSCR